MIGEGLERGLILEREPEQPRRELEGQRDRDRLDDVEALRAGRPLDTALRDVEGEPREPLHARRGEGPAHDPAMARVGLAVGDAEHTRLGLAHELRLQQASSSRLVPLHDRPQLGGIRLRVAAHGDDVVVSAHEEIAGAGHRMNRVLPAQPRPEWMGTLDDLGVDGIPHGGVSGCARSASKG